MSDDDDPPPMLDVSARDGLLAELEAARQAVVDERIRAPVHPVVARQLADPLLVVVFVFFWRQSAAFVLGGRHLQRLTRVFTLRAQSLLCLPHTTQ